MVDILETIVVIFSIFCAISVFDTVSRYTGTVKCDECGERLEIEYNEADSTYYSICDKCEIVYDIKF